ncbi:hypothetical protein [Noviherbaspirillum pedocola]|uniref:Uncharacterized protein n=1 Tax=Noviherbaspirillum pedocola TaxID=2801341 RepID=A0A934W5F4_9BURK|nr:hypothetical protein [Noviherbaspirillum pedocola]MBK4734892.1 hypothetical protein [Noviherbaspirillum pedocola]
MVKISQAAGLSLTTRLKQNRACRLRAHRVHRGSKANDRMHTELSIIEQLQMRLSGSFARHPGRYQSGDNAIAPPSFFPS